MKEVKNGYSYKPSTKVIWQMIFIFTTDTEKYAMKSGSFCYYKSGKGMLQIGTIATNLKP